MVRGKCGMWNLELGEGVRLQLAVVSWKGGRRRKWKMEEPGFLIEDSGDGKRRLKGENRRRKNGEGEKGCYLERLDVATLYLRHYEP